MHLLAAHDDGRLRWLGRRTRGRTARLASAAVLLLALGTLAACGSDEPTPTAPGGGSDADAPVGFEAEWAALIEAAQAEGRLVMAGGGGSVNVRQYYEHFGKKYGITTVVSGGNGTATANRMLAEQAAGRFEVDIIHAGNTTIKARLGPRALQPMQPWLVHPEVVDESLWYLGQHKYGDGETKMNFVYAAEVSSAENEGGNMSLWYNTNLVSQEEIDALETPWDLLQDKWIGEFVSFEPTGGAGGTGQLINAWRDEAMGEEWLRAYWIGMQPFISNDLRTIESSLVNGRFHWGYATSVSTFDQLMAQGAPISNKFPKALTFISELTGGGTSRSFTVVKNPPHPNATKLYINWFLSREGQTLMQASLATPFTDCAYVSLREDDIPPGLTCPHEYRQAGVTYTWEPDLDPALENLRFELHDWIGELLGRTR
ncbi:MAG: ABC transporter substrate-binding protein [Chloroflexi bacterium]|nr:ABC transporter substrate-binding protein [Chloroflexota bacterium]